MKTLVSFFSLALIAFTSTGVWGQPCAGSANIYTFTYNGVNYNVVKEMKTWTAAAACAVELGGSLVEIESESEQAAIYDAIINGAGVSVTYVSVPDGGGVAYVWIGATDKVTEGTWNWDGTNSGAGRTFWTGQGAAGAGNGAPVGGFYNNWGGTSTGIIKEPDDFGGSQDAAAIALRGWPSGSGTLGITGEWNDINIANSLYFVVKQHPVGIGKSEKGAFKLSPNPVKESLTIEGGSSSAIFNMIRILTSDGKEVKRMLLPPTKYYQVDFTNFPSGHYILGIGTEKGSWSYFSLLKQ
ncbi:MAG: hypothetical protein EOM90_10850 [Alphaproteobacteria bacterium]|nr:hypothetical protein [Alphaproteobacteria bacterium]